MVTPCINNIQHFNFQLIHTTLKSVELLKLFKISKTTGAVLLILKCFNNSTFFAVLLILKCFNNSTFFNVVCISWKLKCWMLLMHGVTMKFKVSLFILLNTLCWLDLNDFKSLIFSPLIFVKIHFSYLFCKKWDWKIKHTDKREYGYEEKVHIFNK